MTFQAHRVFCLLFAVAMLCQIPAAQEADPSHGMDSNRFEDIDKLAQRDLAEALRRMRSMENSMAQASPQTQREFRSELISLLLKSGQFDQARPEIEKLKAFGSQFHDGAATAMALRLESVLMQYEGRLDLAGNIVEKAIPLANASGWKDLIALVNDTAARIYLERGNFRVALERELAALDVLKGAGAGADEEIAARRAVFFNTVCTIYLGLKDGKRALEYSDKALAEAKRIASPTLADSFLNERAQAYLMLGDTENAKTISEEALRAARLSSNAEMEIVALGDLSDIARLQGRYEDCVKYVKSVMAMAEKAGRQDFLSTSYSNLGFCHISMGMLEIGKAEIERGFDGLRKANDFMDLEEAYGELATAYGKAGQYKSAVKALAEQRALAKRLFHSGQEDAMAQTQARSDASERQQKIELLQTQNAIQAGELRNRNLQRSIAILSAILVVVATFLTVRQKEALRKSENKSNLDKSKFIADAAHDLSQPMQAIGNLIDAARHAFLRGDAAKGEELIESAQRATQTMRMSFNSVLELSRLESGKLRADYSDFRLADLIDEIHLSLRPLADLRGVTVRVAMSKKAGMVRSDRHLLGRAISNLLTNAIKYSDSRKGNRAGVVIGVVALAGRFRIDVVDNGIGIAAADQENIFKPFFQVGNREPNLEPDREQGLGLGLSIVHSIVHLLDGHRLAMRSRLRRGTRFSMEVPASAESHVAGRVAGTDSAGVDVAGLYVLCIEDDLMVRKSIEALLGEFGILCEASKSVAELAEKLSRLERMPDLILTDHRLAGGTTAVDVVKAVFDEFQTAIPTIVLTGEGEGFQPAEDLENVVILRKPICATALLTQIRTAISRHEAAAVS